MNMNDNTSTSYDAGNQQSAFGGGSGGNPFADFYEKWSEKTAFVTRATCVVMVVSWILSWFINTVEWFACIPYYTLAYFELYRPFISPFVGDSIINLLLILFFYPMMGNVFESSMGSGYYLWLILSITLFANASFILTCVLLYIMGIPGHPLLWQSSGFFIIWFGLITIECLKNPEAPRQLCCLPIEFKAKYMPLVLYGIFCLLDAQILLNLGFAILFGWLYTNGYLDNYRPSSVTIATQEESNGYLHSISRSPGWILSGTLGHDAWLPVSQADDLNSNDIFSGGFGGMGGGNINSSGNNVNEDHFQGSGNMLGGAAPMSSTSTIPVASAIYNPISSLAPVAAPSTQENDSTVTPSRAEIAAKRLAAMEKSNEASV